MWTQQSTNRCTLASISCLGDSFINFWDITKPYSIPFKRSIEQKQFLVDFCCIERSDLVSCSSNGIVMTHSENSAVVMSDSINGISLACNSLGVVQHTYRNSKIIGSVDGKLEDLPLSLERPQWSVLTSSGSVVTRSLSPRDRSHSVNIPRAVSYTNKFMSPIVSFNSLSTTKSDYNLQINQSDSPKTSDPIKPIYNRSKEFLQFAQKYRLSCESPIELCKYNENLARRIGREDLGFVWYFCQCLLVDVKKLTQGVINLENSEQAVASPGSKGKGLSNGRSTPFPVYTLPGQTYWNDIN